jgi:hypothetical protein
MSARISGRLAGARLRAGENVSAFEDQGDGLLLNGGCLLVTLFFDRTQQLGRKADF